MRIGKSTLTICATALVVWAAAATLNQAQPASPPAAGATRVAVVDLVRVFNEFEQTKVLNQKMAVLENELRTQDQKKSQEIDAARQGLQAFNPDSAEYFKKNQELMRLSVEHKVWQAMEQEKVANSHLRWVNKTYQSVEQEIAAVAKKRGCQLVITREDLDTTIKDSKAMLKQIIGRKVIYSDPSVELTDEVLVNLNAAFAKAGGANAIDFGK